MSKNNKDKNLDDIKIDTRKRLVAYNILIYTVSILLFVFGVYYHNQLNNINVDHNTINFIDSKLKQNTDTGLSPEAQKYGIGLAGLFKEQQDVKPRPNKKFNGGTEIICNTNSSCKDLVKPEINKTLLNVIIPGFNNETNIQLLILTWLDEKNNKVLIDVYAKNPQKPASQYVFLNTIVDDIKKENNNKEQENNENTENKK